MFIITPLDTTILIIIYSSKQNQGIKKKSNRPLFWIRMQQCLIWHSNFERKIMCLEKQVSKGESTLRQKWKSVYTKRNYSIKSKFTTFYNNSTNT